MKAFLDKHILFPKIMGKFPYFILIFLLPTLGQIFTEPPLLLFVFLLLLLVFLKFYRDTYEVNKRTAFNIICQLIIGIIFGIFLSDGYLFVFTSYQIGFMEQHYRPYLFLYYLACLPALAVTAFSAFHPFSTGNVINLAFTVFFAIFSPLIARSMHNTFTSQEFLAQSNQRLEILVRQNERERIAGDLHDNLGQAFSIITRKTELAEKLLLKNPELAQKELKEIAETSRANLGLVREIISGLAERTIAETMVEEAKNLRVAEIRLDSKNEQVTEFWTKKSQNVFSQIIKEAVTNMIRHSQATLASIRFEEGPAAYALTISDNGVGIDSSRIRLGAKGLTGMRNRIADLNGSFEIDGKSGTTIKVSLPREDEKNDKAEKIEEIKEK